LEINENLQFLYVDVDSCVGLADWIFYLAAGSLLQFEKDLNAKTVENTKPAT
jgi:hypothetical protein